MRALLLGLLTTVLLPLSANAKPKLEVEFNIGGVDFQISPDRGRGNGPGNGPGRGPGNGPGHGPGDGFRRHGDRIYVNTARVCGLSHIMVHVTGDNLMIQDFDVLFGNGRTQDIPMRQYFRENSYTNWKDLNGQERCIEGFSIKARPDRDWDNARVTLIGWKPWGRGGQQVRLGSALVRDFGRF